MLAMGEYAAMSDPDWRRPLLQGAQRLDVPVMGRNPGSWPGYTAKTAVSAWRSPMAVIAAWDFSVYGGSFGEDDATVLAAAAAAGQTSSLAWYSGNSDPWSDTGGFVSDVGSSLASSVSSASTAPGSSSGSGGGGSSGGGGGGGGGGGW